jgi:bifunctional DNase/RNase
MPEPEQPVEPSDTAPVAPEVPESLEPPAEPLDDLAEPAPGPEPTLEDGPAQFGPGDLVELLVAEVRAAVPLRPGQEAGLAVLAEAVEPFRSLHIYIGQPEARAIQAGRRGDSPSRPGTWDLLLAAVDALGGHLERAVIERVEEARHFYAAIEIGTPDGVKRLECRPSDAIALVVRVPSAGLYTTEEVVRAAGAYP